MAKKKDNYLYYKEKPLIRGGDMIYYGNLTDKYISVIQILDSKEEKGLHISTRLSIKLNQNKGDLKFKPIKKAERDSIYTAIDLAEYWLNEALEMDPA